METLIPFLWAYERSEGVSCTYEVESIIFCEDLPSTKAGELSFLQLYVSLNWIQVLTLATSYSNCSQMRIWIWSYAIQNPEGISPLEESAPVIKNTFFPPRTAIPRQAFMTPQGVSNDLQRYWKIFKLFSNKNRFLFHMFASGLELACALCGPIWSGENAMECRKTWVSKCQKDWESFKHIAFLIFNFTHCKDFHISQPRKTKVGCIMGLKTSGGETQTWSCAGIWVYIWQLEVFIFLP